MTKAAIARPRLSRAESKENTHRALLDAAERCFLELGYPGATLDGIAAEAGFTKGAVYWHFRSKEALFLNLLDEGMKRNREEADRILTLLARKPRRFDEGFTKWIDSFDARNKVALLALELDLESRRNPSIAALLDEVVRKQHVAMSFIIARYFEVMERTPSIPVEEMTKTIIAFSKAVALARQTRHSAELTTAKVMRLLLGMPLAEPALAK